MLISCARAKTPDAPLSPSKLGAGGGGGVVGMVKYGFKLVIHIPATPTPHARP
jgi:hypothetical protein